MKAIPVHPKINSVSSLQLLLIIITLTLGAACSSSDTTTEPAPTDTPQTPLNPDAPINQDPPQSIDFSAVDQAAQDVQQAIGATGSTIAVRVNAQPIYTNAYGDITGDLNPLALASLSKPVTAYVLQKMQDDGLLALSDPISIYVPELAEIPNSARIMNKTLFEFMTHNSGLASIWSYGYADWKARLTDALSQPEVLGNSYANDNFTLLTRVIMNTIGSYQQALDDYINVEGITTFRIGSYHGIPSFAGAGELEATTADYLLFTEKAAPLSEPQPNGFGIAWFHSNQGYLNHIGQHELISSNHHAVVTWNGIADSGATVSLVYQASGVDYSGSIIQRLLDDL